MAQNSNDERQSIFNDTSIADERQDLIGFKGIQPKHQFAFRIFKSFRLLGIIFLGLAAVTFGLTFVKQFSHVTSMPVYRMGILISAAIALGSFLIMLLIKVIALRKCPFDDWVFEVAQKTLGTQVIFYTSKCLYINYDIATSKEVDKKDFVTKMSDLSIHYSYFYVNTFVDQQVIQIECTKKQPIPNSAVLNPEDDLFANIIPVGLTINNTNQTVSPISWTLNPNKENPNLVQTMPSVSFLIAGGTGCHAVGEEILMADKSIKKVEDVVVGDLIMGPDGTLREVLELHRGQEEMFEIETEDGDKHIVNKGHNLHLYNIENKEFIDIPLDVFIALNNDIKQALKLLKVG